MYYFHRISPSLPMSMRPASGLRTVAWPSLVQEEVISVGGAELASFVIISNHGIWKDSVVGLDEAMVGLLQCKLCAINKHVLLALDCHKKSCTLDAIKFVVISCLKISK